MKLNESGKPWADVPTLDRSVLEELREYSSEEQDLAEELIDLFLDDSPKQLMALRRALQDTDRGEVEKRSHRLKGSAGSIGAARLRKICEALESAAREGSEPTSAATDADVAAELEALREALSSFTKRAS